MSRATAEFFQPDGTRIGWGLYNGTSDWMLPWIVESSKAAWAVYYPKDNDTTDEEREESLDRWFKIRKACEHEGQPCIAYADYGSEGLHWRGKYCPQCMVFLGPCDPFEEMIREEGHPFPTAKDAVIEVKATASPEPGSEGGCIPPSLPS